MPVRTAYAGTADPGDIYTAANHDRMPGGAIGYAKVTANQANINGETDLTGLSVAVTVGASRLIRISAHVRGQLDYDGSVPDQPSGIQVAIKEGATFLGGAHNNVWPTSGQAADDPTMEFDPWTLVVAPSEGAHTYKLTMTDTGQLAAVDANLVADSNFPSWILVEDIGPSF